uniref:AT3G52170-like helix-turn-helix domain-containing protein n=1 Tax=Arundo donax TaxID=35708 RepID=A0A0A8XQ20_ARUDO
MQASARLSSSAASRLSSSTASKRVIAGVSSTITRSCYRTSRGKAHAAPLSAQEPPPKGQKRVTKQERRVRIEEFVKKYRASNDGKFPTVTNVRQHVGGGHYTVREVLQELEYNHAHTPLNNAKAAQIQGTDEELSRPKDESKAAQLHSSPKDDNGKNPDSGEGFQSTVDVVISQKDATTSTGIIEKTKTWKSVGPSHYGVETEAAKESLNTSEAFKNVNGPTSSDQTESGSMKVITNEPSISLGVEVKSDSGNKQGKTEANKNAETFLDAHESTVSDQSGSGKVIEGNISDSEHGPKHELQESSNTGLLGSLKSFAYGIRNFLKNI